MVFDLWYGVGSVCMISRLSDSESVRQQHVPGGGGGPWLPHFPRESPKLGKSLHTHATVYFLKLMSQSCQVEHVKFLELINQRAEWLPISSHGGATERNQLCEWGHPPDYQIHCFCKRNHDAIVVLAPSGANFGSL